jgi:hypothetical protein
MNFHQGMLAASAAVLAMAASQASAVVPSCPTATTTVTITSSQTINYALTQIPAANSGVIRLNSGTYNIPATVQLLRSCLTFTSVSASNPATLVWTGGTPLDNTFILDNASAASSHHITVTNLIFQGTGIRLDGYAPKVTGSQFKGGPNGLYFQFSDTGEASNNKFTGGASFISWSLANTLVKSNTFTNAMQPITVSGSSLNNTYDSNTATGSVLFSLELLGAESSLPANERNVGNSIKNNNFSAPSAPLNNGQYHGAYGGISVASGTSNTIQDNTVSCTAICPAFGIEGSGVNGTVTGNTVSGYGTGIYIGQSQPGNPVTDWTLVTGNTVQNTANGIMVNCDTGGANGTDTLNPLVAGCRKSVTISSNIITEARDVGIGGYDYFYTRYTLNAQGQRVYELNAAGTENRYAVNSVSELRALTISSNSILRTYGTYADDSDNTAATHRFIGINLGPILTPANLLVEGNGIRQVATPMFDNPAFHFYGIKIGLSMLWDTGHCSLLPGGQTFQGSVINGKPTKKIYHSGATFGTALQSSCNATNGLTLKNQEISNVVNSVADESTTGFISSGNTCTYVSGGSTVGC